MLTGEPDIETEPNNFVDPTESGFQIETGNELSTETEVVQTTGSDLEWPAPEIGTELSASSATESPIGFETGSGGFDQIGTTMATVEVEVDDNARNIMIIKKKATTPTASTNLESTTESFSTEFTEQHATTSTEAFDFTTDSTSQRTDQSTTEFIIESQSIEISTNEQDSPTSTYDQTDVPTTELLIESTTEDTQQPSDTEPETETLLGTESALSDAEEFHATLPSGPANPFNSPKERESVVQVIRKSDKKPSAKTNTTAVELNYYSSSSKSEVNAASNGTESSAS